MATPFPFENDFTKLFTQYRMPGFDVQALVEAQRRNIDALTRANQLALEGLQTVARRQAEIVRGGIEDASALLRDLSHGKSPEDHVARQTDAAKKALEQALANVRELSEIVTRAGNEAVEVLSKRLGEQIEEAKSLVVKQG
jgi:phasin family protein